MLLWIPEEQMQYLPNTQYYNMQNFLQMYITDIHSSYIKYYPAFKLES